MKRDGDIVRGNKYVIEAGGLQISFEQHNHSEHRGDWYRQQDDDYAEYEEVEDWQEEEQVEQQETGKPAEAQKEEPNYFQTGRFLKHSVDDESLMLLRCDNRFTEKWLALLVDELLASEWKDDVALMWEKKRKRIQLKGYYLGCLKEAGVLKGTNDMIAKTICTADDNYRTLSRYMGDGRQQPYFEWIENYVETH